MELELVRRAARGDGDAFTALASAWTDRCYGLAYRILRDPHEAQDATQRALLAAWRDLPTLREPERFEAWMHRLVVHACYAESRARRRWSARVQLIREPSADADAASRFAEREELEQAFRGLTPEHRAVVVLHHHLGYPLTEIANVLGIPVGTARSRLHYAVRQLRAVLSAEVGQLPVSGERSA